MATLANLREELTQLSEIELLNKFELYSELKSPGVRDEIMLTLLEDEMYNRTLELS